MSSKVKVSTVAYKGSKRKLLQDIESLIKETGANSVFDGFSGSGIVSAYLRSNGYTVTANDLNYSSYIYGKVFLEGFDETVVSEHINRINNLDPAEGWITKNFSGTTKRIIKGIKKLEERPLAFTKENAMILDSARDYVETLEIDEKDKNALVFAIILAANKAFNNSNDQKSAFKNWLPKSTEKLVVELPTMVKGPVGKQLKGDIFDVNAVDSEVIYLDPPYSNGVLYSACYHFNDIIADWSKPELDYSYAIPRAKSASHRGKKKQNFYSKKLIKKNFIDLIKIFNKSKRIIISYSDAPRNLISIDDITAICETFGETKVIKRQHKLCTQFKTQKKVSTELNEYFIVLDQK
jgi:adenine-specific DNA-methyltransferase